MNVKELIEKIEALPAEKYKVFQTGLLIRRKR